MIRRDSITILIVGLVVIGLTAGFLAHLSRSQRLGNPGLKTTPVGTGGKIRIDLPEVVLDYVSSNVEPAKLEVDMLPKDTTFAKRAYVAPDGFQNFTSVVMMGADRTSIHKPEYCLETQGWRILDQRTEHIPIAEPHAYLLPVRKFTTTQTFRSRSGEPTRYSCIYVFWFVAENRVTASHLSRVGYITYDLLRTGVLPRWAYVSCQATCLPGREEATYRRICQWISAAVPKFQLASLPPATGKPTACIDGSQPDSAGRVDPFPFRVPLGLFSEVLPVLPGDTGRP